MFTKTLSFASLALAASLALGAVSPVMAQGIKINKGPVVEPQTNLSPKDWLDFETSHAALGAYANEPWLMVYNATPYPVTVKCDDSSYDLVGPNKYYKNNVDSIPAWSYAPVQVDGWDKYCTGKDSLKGYATIGTGVYKGYMEKLGDFSHSRWLAIVAE
jgi:predicted FMN-binding regulatory protein PaiB